MPHSQPGDERGRGDQGAHTAEDVEPVRERERAPGIEQAGGEELDVHERDEGRHEPPQPIVEAVALVVGDPAAREQDGREREHAEHAAVDQREPAQRGLMAQAAAGEVGDRGGRAEPCEADDERDIGLHDRDQAPAGGPERAREQDRGEIADRERDHRRGHDAGGAARDGCPARGGDRGCAHASHRSVKPGRQTCPGSTIVRGVRILLVTPGLGLGGSERLTLAYARGLVARGHEVLVVHGPPERFSDADVEGISRRRLSGRPTPTAVPRLVPLAALDRAGVPAGRRAHAVGAVDADGRDRASAHAAGHHGPRHRGVGGARRGAAAARRPRARHGRVGGLRRGRQASPPGAERRARPARRRHRATRARRARSAGDGDSRPPAARRVRRAPLPGQGRRRARRGVPAGARSRTGRRPRAGRRRTGHRRR